MSPIGSEAAAMYFERGSKLIHQAKDLHAMKDLQGALTLYKQAIQSFMEGLKVEPLKKVRDAMIQKVKEYLKRADVIKRMMTTAQSGHGPATTPSPASTFRTSAGESQGHAPLPDEDRLGHMYHSLHQLETHCRELRDRGVPERDGRVLECLSDMAQLRGQIDALRGQSPAHAQARRVLVYMGGSTLSDHWWPRLLSASLSLTPFITNARAQIYEPKAANGMREDLAYEHARVRVFGLDFDDVDVISALTKASHSIGQNRPTVLLLLSPPPNHSGETTLARALHSAWTHLLHQCDASSAHQLPHQEIALVCLQRSVQGCSRAVAAHLAPPSVPHRPEQGRLPATRPNANDEKKKTDFRKENTQQAGKQTGQQTSQKITSTQATKVSEGERETTEDGSRDAKETVAAIRSRTGATGCCAVQLESNGVIDLKVLDEYLSLRSYVNGFLPTHDDAEYFNKVVSMAVDSSTFRNVYRWASHIASFSAEEKAKWA